MATGEIRSISIIHRVRERHVIAADDMNALMMPMLEVVAEDLLVYRVYRYELRGLAASQ